MKKAKFKEIFLENVEIGDMAAEGKCVVKHNDLVIFVEFGAPGDIVDIKVTSKKKNFAEGTITNFHKKSIFRTTPFCEHFGLCGGCKWQHIAYDTQLHYKQKLVQDALERIGKVSFPPLLPIVGSQNTTYYRNKLDFTFSNKRWLTKTEIDAQGILERNTLGFHVPGRFDKVLEINHCFLQADPSNAIRLAVREFCLKNSYTFFDLIAQNGLMRNLIIRSSSIGELMVIVQFYENIPEQINHLLQYLANQFSQITSLMYVINNKGNETFNDLDITCFKGQPFIIENMEELQFQIGPKTFYQTNSTQAYELYKITREFAGLTGSELVYDLYTGAGTIANFVAKNTKKVIGIEYVPQAIEDAKINSKINNINNTAFFAGDMKNILNDEFILTHGKPDVIITDPPRAGMEIQVINKILEILPKKIVYVSCNPATQARDLALLNQNYSIKKVQPVDMFPQTHHVENVVLLELI